MIILLDADGPLFDLTGESVRRVNAWHGSEYHSDQWTQWGAHFLEPEHQEWMTSMWAHFPDFWRDLPPTAGAREGVTQLRRAGHAIHVVTSAWVSCKGWEHARRAALKREFDIDAEFVTVTAQKHLLYGNVFVDDKPEHVGAWGQRWTRSGAFLFDMPHNQEAPALGSSQRVNWKRIVELFG